MTNCKVVLSYDGTNFVGWQIQKEGRTVQGEVQRSLEIMHKHPVSVTAAGRTDSGVHAAGQVINFRTDIDTIPWERFCVALSSFLPRDIHPLHSMSVDDRFHARFSAQLRIYRYVWFMGPTLPADLRFTVGHLRHRPSVARLNALCRPLLGLHDFSTFTPPTEPSENRMREIQRAVFYPLRGLLVFEIAANAFLWRMVRSIAGTLIELDKLDAKPIEVEQRLSARDHSSAGPSAPAVGLSLHHVEYPAEYMA